ncbi:MAG: hypothetical protein KKA64_00050 [Nanoarchaeota archaeon]|nr:hypothetical protein [Nanoarchaeota archaeon]
MVECFVCGISDEKERLFDAISNEGVVKICERCSLNEHIPIMRKPTTFQLKEAERKQTVYERLSCAAGISPDRMKKGIEESEMKHRRKERQEKLRQQEIGLKELIERKFKKDASSKVISKKPRLDLVDNFNWVIMMERRKRKLSHIQLAEAIGESAVAIKMAEDGILPEDDYRIINKLENFFRISLKRQKSTESKLDQKQPARILNFKPETLKNLTIEDLKKMKNQIALAGEDSGEEQKVTEEIEKRVEKKGFFSSFTDYFKSGQEEGTAEKEAVENSEEDEQF